MGEICYINGQPFWATIPTGGKDRDDHNNQWDEMIAFLGENCDDIFHWRRSWSWCQEAAKIPHKCREENVDPVAVWGHVIRGYHLECHWYSIRTSSRSDNGGFRPVFMPLDAGTLKPDPSLLKDIPDGRVFALASLYIDGKVIKNPTSPISSEGDIPDYIPGAKIILGDRNPDKQNWLYVIKYKDLLWADRNILKGISWDDLKGQGFISEE